MNTDFKKNSPTIVLAFGSLLLLFIGGPILWVGVKAAQLPSAPAWADPTLYAGAGISGLGYVLFVLTLISACASIIVRSMRSSRLNNESSPKC